MVHRFAVLALGLVLTNAAAAQSQSSPPVLPKVQATADVDLGSYKAESMRTGTKTDTPLREVPQSASVVARKQIEDQSIQNIGEAMLYVPGVGVAQGEGNRETLIMRGNSTTGDFFLDGMRDDVQYYRDLYNIEQLEVLKGP